MMFNRFLGMDFLLGFFRELARENEALKKNRFFVDFACRIQS